MIEENKRYRGGFLMIKLLRVDERLIHGQVALHGQIH